VRLFVTCAQEKLLCRNGVSTPKNRLVNHFLNRSLFWPPE
jgi:hypothetical protein